MIAAAAMGDPNASIPTPQPVHYRPMFGAFGRRAAKLGDLRLAGGARASRRWQHSGSRRPLVAVHGHAQAHQEGHDAQRRDADDRGRSRRPTQVRADGELLTCEPATVLPMAQRYFLF